MAIEQKRRCGYRKVGGLYLVGEYSPCSCDRLPLELTVCRACGQGIRVSRSPTEINALDLWGRHDRCDDERRPCLVCDPRDDVAYLMGAGEGFYHTPGDFLNEAVKMGVSKRIAHIPKNMVMGRTVVFIAHPKAVPVEVSVAVREAESILASSGLRQPELLPTLRTEWRPGVISAFIPQRIEKLIWQSQATPVELERLEKQGIKPVIVPDGDEDHG